MTKQIQIIAVWLFAAAFLVVIANATAVNEPPAGTPEHGAFAAAIRSAQLPCAHVVEVEAHGSGTWQVKCNAGLYRVVRTADGQLAISIP